MAFFFSKKKTRQKETHFQDYLLTLITVSAYYTYIYYPISGLLTRPFTRSDCSGLEEVQDFMDSIVKQTLLKRGFLCELFLFSLDEGNDYARPAWVR